MIRIETESIIIRDFLERDFEFYCDLESREESIKFEEDKLPTIEEIRKKFEGILALKETEKRSKYSVLLESKEENKAVGRLIIWSISENIDEWEMGWIMSPDYYKRGYASKGARALIDYGFKTLNANRIRANCNDKNIASQGVMIKIGMTKEGVLRQTRFLNNEWYGSCIYSILKDEYQL